MNLPCDSDYVFDFMLRTNIFGLWADPQCGVLAPEIGGHHCSGE